MLEVIVDASFVFYALFAAIGIFDGLYFHLIKFALHRRAESQREHLIHVFRSALLAPISFLLFVENSQGPLLYLACGLIAVDFVAEIFDIFEEKTSRSKLGGICMEEYCVHVAATSFRVTAIALMLIAKSQSAGFEFSKLQTTLGSVVSLFGVAGVAHHVFEMLRSSSERLSRQRVL